MPTITLRRRSGLRRRSVIVGTREGVRRWGRLRGGAGARCLNQALHWIAAAGKYLRIHGHRAAATSELSRSLADVLWTNPEQEGPPVRDTP
jgi:hypothetical protein